MGEKDRQNQAVSRCVIFLLLCSLASWPLIVRADPAKDSAKVGTIYPGTNKGDCPDGPGAKNVPIPKNVQVKTSDSYCGVDDNFRGFGNYAKCAEYCVKTGSCGVQ